jgi:peptide/nickel transport system permease protein
MVAILVVPGLAARRFRAAAISALIGGTVGILSGFFGGKTDTTLMRVTDYFLVIPDVPLMIVVAAHFGRSTWNIIVIIGIIYWTFTARLFARRRRASGAGLRAARLAPGAGNPG